MKHLTTILLLCFTLSVNAEYRLVWQDEFNTFNNKIWTHETGWGDNGWGNWEQEVYTDAEENSNVEDGVLKINALPIENSTDNTVKYTSARIKTEGNISVRYGKIEARMKLPERGQGVWPAFWMLGESIAEKGWPYCGEIDIMEWRGAEPNSVVSTSHWNGTPNEYQHCEYGNTLTMDYPLDEDFYTFGVEWTPHKLEYYIIGKDDKKTIINVIDISVATYNNGLMCFHEPAFLLINLAMGGMFGGNVDEGLGERTLRVDWIRIWQDSENYPSSMLINNTKESSIKLIEKTIKVQNKEGIQIKRETNDTIEYYDIHGRLIKREKK